ncbi:MAG: DUF721 domain-containing protein [Deltaproteobacteria bacterium]|jgi:hypothetical protein|nr:DUF721 domain-containing protein [Deltaproteobacteria bacterium]
MDYQDRRRHRRELISIEKIIDRSANSGFLHFMSNRARLTELWRQTVGPEVAAKTNIRSFELGRMVVAVQGPAYLERYRYLIENWKKRLNIEYGDEVVTEIVLRIGES